MNGERCVALMDGTIARMNSPMKSRAETVAIVDHARMSGYLRLLT